MLATARLALEPEHFLAPAEAVAWLVLMVIIVSIANRISTMKKTLLTVALLSLVASSSFADALLFTVSTTPYDNQMARIRPVLTAPSRASSNGVSMNLVNKWMGDLRSIPYGLYHDVEDSRRSTIGRACGLQSQGGRSLRKDAGEWCDKRSARHRQTHLKQPADACLAGLGHPGRQLCSRPHFQLDCVHDGEKWEREIINLSTPTRERRNSAPLQRSSLKTSRFRS